MNPAGGVPADHANPVVLLLPELLTMVASGPTAHKSLDEAPTPCRSLLVPETCERQVALAGHAALLVTMIVPDLPTAQPVVVSVKYVANRSLVVPDVSAVHVGVAPSHVCRITPAAPTAQAAFVPPFEIAETAKRLLLVPADWAPQDVPFEENRIVPPAPTAQMWPASAAATPKRSCVVPVVCLVQVAPPFVVSTIVPCRPTATTVFASIAKTAIRS